MRVINFSGSQLKVPSGGYSLSLSIYYITSERLVCHTNMPKFFSSSLRLFWRENNEKVFFCPDTVLLLYIFYLPWQHKSTAQLPFSILYSCVFFFAFLTGHELVTDWTEITVVTNTKQTLTVEKYAYGTTLVVIHHSNELRWRTTNFWSLRIKWELLLVFLWDLVAFTL